MSAAGFVVVANIGRLMVDCCRSKAFTPPVPLPVPESSPHIYRRQREAFRDVNRAVRFAESHGRSLVSEIPAVSLLVDIVPTMRVESLRKRAKAVKQATGNALRP